MQKAILAIIFVMLLSVSSSSAQKSWSFFKNKLEVGGGFSAGFSNNQLGLGISPTFGVRLTPRLYLGLGLSYEYYYQTIQPKAHTNVFGISFLSRFLVFQGLYLQAEYDISTSFYKDSYNNKAQATERHLLLGGGYQQKVADRLYAYVSVLWDVFYKDYPYSANPVFQVGVGYLF